MFEHKFNYRASHFLILVNNNYRLCIIRNRLVNNGCLVLWILYISEEFLYLCLDLVYIYITNDDNTLMRWMIPLYIIVTQLLWFEVINNTHQSNRITYTILTTGIELWKMAFKHTALRTCTQTPFFMDNATFFLYFFFVKSKPSRPVTKNQHTCINSSCTLCRNIVNIVNCLINTCIGIKVTTKFDTVSTTPFDKRITLKIVRTIKSHVLKEMGKTTLCLILLN